MSIFKNTLIVLAFIVTGSNLAWAQNLCDAPIEIKNFYRESAYNMAYDNIYQNNLSAKDSIIVPESLAQERMEKLIAVYNSSSKERDTIVDLLAINYQNHAWCPYLHTVIFGSAQGLKWAENLNRNIFPTGNTALDSLINRFEFTLKSTVELPQAKKYGFTLTTEKFINPELIIPLFEKVKELEYPNSLPDGVGDGDIITDSTINDYTLITYSYGMGDCPSGCTERRYWEFKVDHNCEATFVRSYGDPYKKDGPNNANAIEKPRLLSVYPNPTNNLIIINIPETIAKASLKLYDLSGRLMITESIEGRSSCDLSIESLAKGSYIVLLEGNNNIYRSVVNKL